jgi:intracellular multiplication protein IcmJ
MKTLPKLQISAKAKSWRVHDHEDKQNEDRDAYEMVRAQVLRRDNMTCQFCGFKSQGVKEEKKNSLLYSGYLEVHHLDDDHSNNDPENLVTACPFCHSVFHSGFAGHHSGAKIAFMPYMKQEDISLLFNLMSVIHHSESSEHIEIKKEIVELFNYFTGISDSILEGLSDAATLGSVLVGIQIKSPEVAKKMNNVLWGLRLIPNIESETYKKAADYWRTNTIWLPEDQWMNVLTKHIKLNKESLKK